jgi:hypothetical protein
MPRRLTLPRPHPAQAAILRSPARFRVVACGRRFGKTTAGQLAIVQAALAGGVCWWLSPTYPMADQVWRDLKRLCAPLQPQISESDRRLALATGSIAIRSAFYADRLRGAGLDLAVLDEAAFMAADVWPEVVRPMLLDRGGSALFLSSPNGRNWFWDVFQMGQNRAVPDWAAFHFTSFDNPRLPRADLETLRQQTPERIWRVEYLAEFVDDDGLVFRGVRAAATAPLHAAPEPGAVYVAGVDWGRDRDYTAIAVIDAGRRTLAALDRFNQIGWAMQRGRLRAVYDRWRPAVMWAEANSIGAPNIEALQSEGLPVRPFHTTATSKAPLIEALALAIERGDLALLPDDTLLDELAAYRLERLPGGGWRYGAPSGGHDDMVIALALAWHGLRGGSGGLDFV